MRGRGSVCPGDHDCRDRRNYQQVRGGAGVGADARALVPAAVATDAVELVEAPHPQVAAAGDDTREEPAKRIDATE